MILPSSTEAQITNLHHSHAAKETLFNEYDRTNKALLQKLIITIDKMFVCSLQHKCIGYVNISTQQILDHLYATYTNISPYDLQDF